MSIFDQYENSTDQIDHSDVVDYRYTDPESEDNPEMAEKPSSHHYRGFVYLSLLIFGLLIWRLVDVQIVQGTNNAVLAKANSVRQVINPAKRGGIFDSRGVWLARNVATFQVQLTPSNLPKKLSDRNKVYDQITNALGWTEAEKQSQITQIEKKILVSIEAIVLKDEMTRDDALILTEKLNNIDAVAVVPTSIRQYNNPTNGLSFILGYVGKANNDDIINGSYHLNDTVGKNGLESSYDIQMRGTDGVIQEVVDSRGKVLQALNDSNSAPVSGNNLVLKIDNKLQNIMYTELSKGLQTAGITSGVAIAMDPRDGGILGMVSLPAYDNNLFANGVSSDVYQKLSTDPTKPLFSRATQGTYPSGSTIKPFVASVGLNDGVITENTKIDTPPEITIGPWRFPNWQNKLITGVDVKKAIAESNDIFFYAVGGGYDKIGGLGVDRLSKGLGLFGFGKKTGVDLPSESTGLIPNAAWKKSYKGESWYIGDTYHMAIGQGDLLVTPLQLVTALSAVANGGTLYQPHIVDKIMDDNDKVVSTIKPTVASSNFIDPKNIQIVREGMLLTNTSGSGRSLATLPVPSGGKTGTAQVGANNEYLNAWYEVFAPYDNPTIALVVLGEKGPLTNEGNSTAVPVAKAILQQYFSPDYSK
ncbi:MAG: penicillin-binding protein 2 [Patescibacteria group bacterium]